MFRCFTSQIASVWRRTIFAPNPNFFLARFMSSAFHIVQPNIFIVWDSNIFILTEYRMFTQGLIVTFLAKLFPQLCLCHWNGNCDLFVVHNCQKGHDLFTSYERQKGHNCDLFTSYERQKGHNCDLSVTFLLVKIDIVNDKKGHNFMNDKTYWFSGNFCLVWKKYWKSSSFFCKTGSATILNFYLKSRSQEVGCVF